MVQERSTSADVLTSLPSDCDRDGNQLDALGVCGGDCTADADADGICDDVDDCVAAMTRAVCAMVQERSTSADVLTSPLATATVTATSSTPSACVAVTAQADADADGICDDVDDCVGSYDACGVCNGPGEIYECGCSDIPAGDCDCDGNSSTPGRVWR